MRATTMVNVAWGLFLEMACHKCSATKIKSLTKSLTIKRMCLFVLSVDNECWACAHADRRRGHSHNFQLSQTGKIKKLCVPCRTAYANRSTHSPTGWSVFSSKRPACLCCFIENSVLVALDFFSFSFSMDSTNI